MTLDDWQILAAVVGIFGLIAAILQLGWQIDLHNRERAVEAYFRFTDRFSDLSKQYYDLRDRVERMDSTVGRAQAEAFFRTYWQSQLQQWEFMCSKLLPPKIYVGWLLYASDYMFTGRDVPYFESPGVRASLGAAEAYKLIGADRVLRNQPGALAFFNALLAQASTESWRQATMEWRMEQVASLVLDSRRSHGSRWSNGLIAQWSILRSRRRAAGARPTTRSPAAAPPVADTPPTE